MVQWNAKANEIFVRASEFDAADKRRRFVESECGEDATLLAQVEALLAAGDRMGSFLEKPVAPGRSPPRRRLMVRPSLRLRGR